MYLHIFLKFKKLFKIEAFKGSKIKFNMVMSLDLCEEV